MLPKYYSSIRNYVLSVSSQRKYNFYHKNTLVYAFRTNSRKIIGRNPSMVIPLQANEDLTLMLLWPTTLQPLSHRRDHLKQADVSNYSMSLVMTYEMSEIRLLP